jgi:hypothetical protein
MLAFQTFAAKTDVNPNLTISTIHTAGGLPKQSRVQSVKTAGYSEI